MSKDSKGLTREQLEENVTSITEKEILELIESVVKQSCFITNRNRLNLVRKIDKFVTNKIYKAITGREVE